MKTWKSRGSLHAELLSFATADDDGIPKAVTEPSEDMIEWMAQMASFYGVPFEYLVPDARMLPPESLRFFFVDANWVDRMIDGALSIGLSTALDQIYTKAWYAEIYDRVQVAVARLRDRLRGKPSSAEAPSVITGCLLRSTVVSSWPGLEVSATQGGDAVSGGGTELPLLRVDHLADDLLLVLVAGVPDDVLFTEPGEALHFGVLGSTDNPTYTVKLRGLGLGGYSSGEQIFGEGEKPLEAAGKYRTVSAGGSPVTGVLDIQDLVASIDTAMPSGALGPSDAIAPGGFAIQMVRGAGRMIYGMKVADEPVEHCPPKTVEEQRTETKPRGCAQ